MTVLLILLSCMPCRVCMKVRRICEAHDITYMAYSSFGTQWHKEMNPNSGIYENPVLAHPVLANIAKRHHVNPTDVILSWVIQEGAVAIPRSTKPSHLQSNIDIIFPDPGASLLFPTVADELGYNQDKSNGKKTLSATFLSREDIQNIRLLDGTRKR